MLNTLHGDVYRETGDLCGALDIIEGFLLACKLRLPSKRAPTNLSDGHRTKIIYLFELLDKTCLLKRILHRSFAFLLNF